VLCQGILGFAEVLRESSPAYRLAVHRIPSHSDTGSASSHRRILGALKYE
jgi:hypothetical protein